MADVAIGLTITEDTGAIHVRSWYVPPHLAVPFAEHMTAWYGQPDEMTSTLDAVEAGGDRLAAEGGAVFLIGAESGSDA